MIKLLKCDYSIKIMIEIYPCNQELIKHLYLMSFLTFNCINYSKKYFFQIEKNICYIN